MIRGFVDLWRWEGTVGRGRYAATGLILFALKHNIDRIVAHTVFGRPWSFFNYLAPGGTVRALGPEELRFYGTLLALALPFIWIGVAMTVRRLRAAGLPTWLVPIFFLPVINVLFFLALSLIPNQPSAQEKPPQIGLLDRLIPDNAAGSAAMGVLLTLVPTVAAVALGTSVFGQYGWGLFVGLPFCLGLGSVLIYGYARRRSLGSCLLVSWLAVGFTGAALVGIAIEGIICLFMAAPLALLLASLGAWVGYTIQRNPRLPVAVLRVLVALLFVAPTLMAVEYAAGSKPPLLAVRTAIDVDAPPERVWRHVVAFAELPAPRDWLFRAGVAYPMRAEIQGRGVGAVRHCVFSTGPFVEPIQVWEEPRLLKFSVTAQPHAMREWSPYGPIRSPHLDNYLVSEGGQFLLTPLPDGRTRLEGTTWYRNKMWPSDYWQGWADWIIHRIHLRVLRHVEAEVRMP